MTMEEDSIDQASSTRRERLKALRAAKEYMSLPDGEPAQDQSRTEEQEEHAEEMRVTVTEEVSIAQAAAARREKLDTLKTAKELLSTPDEDLMQNESEEDNSDELEEKNLNIKFRNYLPHDKQLQEGKLAPPVLPKFEDPVGAAPPSEKIEDPFVNIAPKKPNWDLRRDVQKKLDKLERRTQKALYQLMQEQEKEKEVEGQNSVTED